MKKEKKYIFNSQTLSYEVIDEPRKRVYIRLGVIAAVGLVCFFAYFYLFTGVLGMKTPKELVLENRNRELVSKMQMLERRMEEKNEVLVDIQMRDNMVYRPIFGMDEISSDVRNAGFGGVDRYSSLEQFEHSALLVSTAMKMDILTKKTYIQSRSFDEVSVLAKRAGEMAACVPSIYPFERTARVHQSSSFGYRFHPIRKSVIFHEGIDFSGPSGEPIFATGDGVVEQVQYQYFGYGNCVVIDHGFGYKTRYAHLKETKVTKGQKVSRGDQIATMGNTGQSTGTHLHYEVIYMGKHINPWNFLNGDVSENQ